MSVQFDDDVVEVFVLDRLDPAWNEDLHVVTSLAFPSRMRASTPQIPSSFNLSEESVQ